MNKLIWAEISASNLKHNLQTIKKRVVAGTLISPCVKANAYGHGLVEVSKILEEGGADWLSVNCLDEAIILREAGIKLPILIMGYVLAEEREKLFGLDVRIFLYDLEGARVLSKMAREKNQELCVHIKVDTGMGRQGIFPEKVVEFIKEINSLGGLKVEGLATHFASADELTDSEYFEKQVNAFKKIITDLEKENIEIPIINCSNSAASLIGKSIEYNLIRPGISVYGLYPSEEVKKECEKNDIILKPVLSLKTKVTAVKELTQGNCVSYGMTCKLERDSRVAVLPIGYSDGIDRALSNVGEVLIGGKRAKILGRVCMNTMMVDVTDIPEVEREDEVVLIGVQETGEISVDEIAILLDTINYEVTTRLRESIEKIIIN